MAITTNAAITPTLNRPVAQTIDTAAVALQLLNYSPYSVDIYIGAGLHGTIAPYDAVLFTGLPSTAVEPWAVVIPRYAANVGVPSGATNQLVITTFANGDALPTVGSFTPGSLSPADPLQLKPKRFGALGNGVTDDTAAIQACLDVARIIGGGEVDGEGFTYLVSQAGANVWALLIGAKTTLRSMNLRLAASQANQLTILKNFGNSAGGDTDITVKDVRIDGNADNQATNVVDAHFGIQFLRVRRVRLDNVFVTNVFGSTTGANGPNGQPGEGMHIQLSLCADVQLTGCRAHATSTHTSTGISLNDCTHFSLFGCVSDGMAISNGFALFHCRGGYLHGCAGYLNTNHGYNLTTCDKVMFHGCRAGGLASVVDGNNNTPFTDSQALGNSQVGFNCVSNCTDIDFYGCESANNGLYGLQVTGGTAANIRWHGGQIKNNTNFGTATDSNQAGSAFAMVFDGGFVSSGNGTNQIFTGAAARTVAQSQGLQATFAVPASGTTITNPFPFTVGVYISGGTVSQITVDGNATGLTSGCIVLQHKQTLALTYTGAPTTFLWFALQ